MAATFTTEQYLPVSFKLIDGRGRPAPVDGDPTIASSDETVAVLDGAPTDDGNGNWSFSIASVAEGAARISVSVDADMGEGTNEIIGLLDVTVTLDPRTAERTVELTAGAASDEPLG